MKNKSKIVKQNATFAEIIDMNLDEESNEGGDLETQKLPKVCEEIIKFASNPEGVMPVVLIKLQNALKTIQPSRVESKGGGMYLVFLVIVTVIVLLQCLSCSFGQN